MKKTILLTILIISLALTGCALKKNVEVGNNSQNGKAQNTANENTQVANPASLFCIEKGGKSQIVETEAGQAGICKFDDGSECDEWAFFRKECQPGQTDNVQIPSGQTGITISGIKDGQTIYSPLVVFGRAPVEKDVLVVELRNAKHETLVKEKTNIDDSGFYAINKLNFDFKNTNEGFVAVYEEGEDGSELNLVEIPVKFGNLDTSNWQTYKNEEYGFEVIYPKDWQKYGGARVDICPITYRPDNFSYANVHFQDSGCGIEFMDVFSLNNEKCAYIHFTSPGFNYDWEKCKNLLSNINEERRSASAPSSVSAWLRKTEIPSEAQESYKIFDKIISTFKFTN